MRGIRALRRDPGQLDDQSGGGLANFGGKIEVQGLQGVGRPVVVGGAEVAGICEYSEIELPGYALASSEEKSFFSRRYTQICADETRCKTLNFLGPESAAI
jgi:hypothetical protein